MYLFIKTKNQKGAEGFKVNNIDHAFEIFKRKKEYWDNIQKRLGEKSYKFTATIEDDKGNVIMDAREFCKKARLLNILE